MLQKFVSTTFVVGALLTALMPAVGLARDHDGGGRNGSGSRNYAPRGYGGGGSRYSGGQRYDGRRGYSGGSSYYSRGYFAPRSYRRPVYRGYYNGGLYLGYGAPYGYAYDPGYSYGPAPAPQPCSEGAYDRYGNWVPNPYCYGDQQQYQQQYYDQPYDR